MITIAEGRQFLKGDLWEEVDFKQTPQARREPKPPLEAPYPADAPLFDLIAPAALTVGRAPLLDLINARKSRRKYTDTVLSLEELSFLLWATQGVHRIFREGIATMRTVPSAGARHPFETYLLINRVTGLTPGLYRYLALEHKLYLVRTDPELPAQMADACNGQDFCGNSAVTFVWTAIPYRTEWRYDVISHKMIALDAGHICQNLYLACGAIGAGTCAVGAYNQQRLDALLSVDGVDEFVVYVAPVGKIQTGQDE